MAKLRRQSPTPRGLLMKDPEFIIQHGRFITGGALAWVGQDLEGLTGSKGGLTRSRGV